jgi:hypothetical protein
MRRLRNLIIVVFLSMIALVSCNNNDEYVISEGKGRINVLMTDAPFPVEEVSNALVTIDKVEIRKKIDGEQDEDSDSFIVINEEEMLIDLLQLTNGITEEIAYADLDPGLYDLIRLHVVEGTVIMNDGQEYNLKVPSGSASGLKVKIDPGIYLEEGQTSDVLLDFDVSKSFVVRGNFKGNFNGFIFKPVVRGVFLGAAGRIEGTVTDTTASPVENAYIKLFTDEEGNGEISDSLFVSSFSDEDGNYKLIGLPEGFYTAICEHEDYESDTVRDISVTKGNATTVNFLLE